jgi:hypothetical protein
MLNPGVLTFREFAMHEPLPLANIQNAVLDFLRGRDDAVVFGAQAVIAYHQRRGSPKSGTDWRDPAMLLLAFPDLKRESGPVVDGLQAASAGPAVLSIWKELVAQEIRPPDEDDEF